MGSLSDSGRVRALRFESIARALAATHLAVWSWETALDVVHWSPEVEALFGADAGEFASTFEAYLGRAHPEDVARVKAALAESIRRATELPRDHAARTFVIEHRIVRSDGAVAWIEARGHIELDVLDRCSCVTGMFIDVTPRKLAEATLRQEAAEYRLFTEFASDYVYEAEFAPDHGMRTMVVAGSFERTTGHAIEALEREGGWIAIVHPEDRAQVRAALVRLAAGESQVSEYRILSPEGDVRWLRDYARPIASPTTGRVAGARGGVTDITQVKRLESELIKARKLEAIGRLASAVVHDFNNLLTVIVNSADFLVREHATLAHHEDLQAIIESAQRGAELTHSLLTLARRQTDAAQPIRIDELVMSAQPVLGRVLGERVQLQIVPSDDPINVLIDRGQALLLLLNLGLNARDAMPEGGLLRVSVSRAGADDGALPAELSAGEYAVITVSDSGLGISPDIMPHLFEPFFTTKGEGKGTGLGLATCQSVARAAGGTITAESRLGLGATFRVYLPITERTSDVRAAPVLSDRGGRETLLVVEDRLALRRLIAREMRDRGYAVVVAESAEEALRLLSEPGREFDLALIDVGLSGAPGTELAIMLRREVPRTQVVLMSGNPGDDATRALIAAGVPFVEKPFSTRHLAALIRQILDVPTAH